MIKGLILSLIISVSSSYASEAIGYYSKKGKLKGAHLIDNYDMTNIIKLYRSRGQNYGTSEIMGAITDVANYISSLDNSVERMQVGDIANITGGKIPRHASHQNGLDADVVYYRVNEKEQDESYPEWKELFVKNGKLSPNFHMKRNWLAFKFLVKNYKVGRIFVDPVIKKAICKYTKEIGEYESETEVLRLIRPLKQHHASHYHLRLLCPKDDKSCRPQGVPAPGPGC